MSEPKKKKFSLSSFGLLLRLVKPYRLLFAVAMVALALGSGVNLLFPEIIRQVLNSPSWNTYTQHPTLLALTLVGLFGFQGICFYIRIYFFGVIGQQVVADLRKKIFSTLLHRPIAEFDQARSGDLVSRLMNDTSLIQDAVSIKLSVLIRYSVQIVIGIIAMVWLSWRLTIAVVISLLVLTSLSILLAKRLRAYSRALQTSLGDASALAEESFSSIRIIRGFKRESYLITRFAGLMDQTLSINTDRTSLSAFFQSFVNFLLNGSLVLVLLYGIFLTTKGTVSVGDLTAFLLYGAIVAVSFAFTTSCVAELAASLGGIERITPYLETNTAAVHLNTERPQDNANAIEFHSVSFTYPTRTEAALQQISFVIPKGKQTAIVGVSGSGKSTLVNLILGFYQPSSGQVLVGDGPTVFVPQENRLLNLSVLETIRLGDESITDSDVIKAISEVNMSSTIATLPEGTETVVGESGNLLSGGQKQRLAIARALVRKPKILLLDEATASLDSENESEIQATLKALDSSVTQIVIAHRLSTIREADHVIVLGNGRIIQQGSFSDLSHQEGFFKEYLRMQSLLSEH